MKEFLLVMAQEFRYAGFKQRMVMEELKKRGSLSMDKVDKIYANRQLARGFAEHLVHMNIVSLDGSGNLILKKKDI